MHDVPPTPPERISAATVLGIVAALMRRIGLVQAAILDLGPSVRVYLNSLRLLPVRSDARSVVSDALRALVRA